MYSELETVWAELTGPDQPYEIHIVDVNGSPVRSYRQVPSSLREFWLASAEFGDADYLIFQDERISYRQAHEYVASIANWLQQQGIGQGDRVAIAMRNYPEWMLAYWAITSLGAAVVGVNAWWVAGELAYALEDSKPRLVICDHERLQRVIEVRDQFPDLGVVVVRPREALPDWAVDWQTLLEAPAELPAASIDPDDDACIFYTSGTTGRPKGAQLTHRGCVNNIANVGFVGAVQREALVRAGIVPAEVAEASANAPVVALLATPLFHVTGNNCVAQAATAVGGAIVHMYKWTADDALDLIERERVTVLSAVPVMARELVMHEQFRQRDMSSLLSIGGGGAAVQPDLVTKIARANGVVQPSAGYGMTETCGLISMISSAFLADQPTSVGRPLPTVEAKCVDADGNAVPAGEAGELWVRGAPIIKGYLNRPDATADTITDGWLHTGDIARIDDNGFIHLVDRAKDMVLRGGENVYCAEVENALFDHDGVAESVVFAVPDDRLGEEVGAAVYLQEGVQLGADELRAHCAQQLAPFKIPRYIWILDDPLPRNANGKFLKRELRDTLPIETAL